MLAVTSSHSAALWYLTRAFGMVTMVLLTISVVMGISQVVRFAVPRTPRFVVAGLHRNVSLLALVFLAVHIVTAVADPFAPVRMVDAFLPFASKYRPFWLGLGAVATDMLIAMAVTSLLRTRLGYGPWRAIHWLAYLCWPVALVHGLGTGSDARLGWVQLVYAVCVLAVLFAVAWRLATKWSTTSIQRRLAAGVTALLATVAVAAWTAQGPLKPGWAKRSGTPANLLGALPSSVPTTAQNAQK